MQTGTIFMLKAGGNHRYLMKVCLARYVTSTLIPNYQIYRLHCMILNNGIYKIFILPRLDDIVGNNYSWIRKL